jgi:hypothetical protein
MSDSSAIVNDTFHGKDVQLDGYSVLLTIDNCTRVMKVKGTGSMVRAIQQLLLIDYFTH